MQTLIDMETSDDKDMLMRKLAMHKLGCRNILYWVIVYLRPIPEKISRNDMLLWNSEAKHP